MINKIVISTIAISSLMYAQNDINTTKEDINNTQVPNNIGSLTTDTNVQKEVHKLLSINQQVEKINQLAINKQLSKALPMISKLYDENPTNKNVAQTYAKLLFWDGKVDKASDILTKSGDTSSKLYKQIYTSKHIHNLKTIKSSTQKIKTIKSLEPFAQKDYEIMWIMMNAYIKKHQYYHALKTAKEISKLYPKSIEAKESVARLYFWTKNYNKSLSVYKSLKASTHKPYTKEIRQLKRALYNRHHHKNTKHTKIVKKDNKPELFETNDDLQYQVMKLSRQKEHTEYMVGIGYDYFRFSDKRYTDNTKYIEATIPIGDFILYNKIEDTHRYGLHDTQYYAELYPTMPKPWWGYLSFSFTPSADFYAKYSIGWHQYYDIGNWEFGLGYNYAKYSTIHTNTIIALYTYYFTDNLYFTQTGYYVPSNKSWSIVNKIDYKLENHHKYYFEYIKSDSYENDDEISILLRNDIKSDKFQAGFEVPIVDNYHLGTDVSYEKFDTRNNSYNRKELNVYFRYYW